MNLTMSSRFLLKESNSDSAKNTKTTLAAESLKVFDPIQKELNKFIQYDCDEEEWCGKKVAFWISHVLGGLFYVLSVIGICIDRESQLLCHVVHNVFICSNLPRTIRKLVRVCLLLHGSNKLFRLLRHRPAMAFLSRASQNPLYHSLILFDPLCVKYLQRGCTVQLQGVWNGNEYGTSEDPHLIHRNGECVSILLCLGRTVSRRRPVLAVLWKCHRQECNAGNLQILQYNSLQSIRKPN